MSASSIEAADGPPPVDVATYYTKTAFIEAASRILAISSIQAAEAWDDLKGDLGIDCDSATHKFFEIYAVCMIIVCVQLLPPPLRTQN